MPVKNSRFYVAAWQGACAIKHAMKPLLSRPYVSWYLTAGVLGLWAAKVFIEARKVAPGPLWLLGIALGCVTAGLIERRSWARLSALLALGVGAVLQVRALLVSGLTVSTILQLVGLVLLAVMLWKQSPPWRRDAPASDALEQEPGAAAALTPATATAAPTDTAHLPKTEDAGAILSLVHLRRQQRGLDALLLAKALSRAWQLKIVPEEDAHALLADGFVAGSSPVFIVIVNRPVQATFVVNNHANSYFENAARVAAAMPNMRLAQIIHEHAGWLSVDLMRVKAGQLGQDEAYKLIGQAVAALADDAALAILCPQHRFFNLWSPELARTLCSSHPLEALRQEVKPPVIGVTETEAIAQATTEARERWPEFVACFQQRNPERDAFLVKAPFAGDSGQQEHMWVRVLTLGEAEVTGRLTNDPLYSSQLKKGDAVAVPVGDVSDWLCADAHGQPVGNFTQQAVARAASGAPASR